MKKPLSAERRKQKRLGKAEYIFVRSIALSAENTFFLTLTIVFISQIFLGFTVGRFEFDNKLVENLINAAVLTSIATPFLWKTILEPFRAIIDSVEGKAQREVLEKDGSLRAILEFAPMGIAIMTRQGKFIQINQRFASLLDLTVEKLMKTSYSPVLGLNYTGVPNETPDDFKKVPPGGGSSYTFNRAVSVTGGGLKHFTLTLCPVKNQKGTLGDVVCLMVESSQPNQPKE